MDREPSRVEPQPPKSLEALKKERRDGLFEVVAQQAVESRAVQKQDKERRNKARSKARMGNSDQPAAFTVDTSIIEKAQSEKRMKERLARNLADGRVDTTDISTNSNLEPPTPIKQFLERKAQRDEVRNILMNPDSDDDQDPPKGAA